MPASTMTKVRVEPSLTRSTRVTQHAGVADQHPAGLDDQPAAEVADGLGHDARILLGRGTARVLVAVGNAEAAAEVEGADREAVGAQHRHQIAQPAERLAERRDVDELRADVHRQHRPGRGPAAPRRGVDAVPGGPLDAELVFAAAGGDFIVGVRVDVGVDAQCRSERACPAIAPRGPGVPAPARIRR